MFLNSILKNTPRRILSAIVDQVTLVVSFMIFSVGYEFASTPEQIHRFSVNTAIFLFSLFLNKDIYFGKSIGKYFTGLRVVCERTGSPAGPIRCLIRNLFLLLWPIEALTLLLSHERRIGDVIAGTKVLEGTEIGRENKWQYIEAVLSAVGSITIVYYLFHFIDDLGIMNP